MSAEVVSFAPARARLPKVDPLEAAAANRALALLDGLEIDDPAGLLRLAARTTRDPHDGGWLRFDTGAGEAAICAGVIAGAPALPLPEGAAADLPAALHQLSRLEPLIAAIERAIGLPLDPVGLGRGQGLVLELDAVDATGAQVHAVRFAVDPACAAGWPEPAPPAGLGPAGHAAAVLRAVLDGPRAPVAELPLLSRGDVVVLPRTAAAGWACRLSSGDDALARGFLDLGARLFTVQDVEIPSMLETALRDADVRAPAADGPSPLAAEPQSFAPRAAAAEAAAATPAVDSLTIRLGVELGEVRLPLKALAGLKPGSVVALPGEDADLTVELKADGRTIAVGRLVSLGDAYGVLVDNVRAS